MSALPKNFKTEFLDGLLQTIWRQWCALGVQGHAADPCKSCIDPEALVLFTCSIGRRDPRIFDLMMGWLGEMGWLCNTQRFAALLRSRSYTGAEVLYAVSELLTLRPAGVKWSSLAARSLSCDALQPLFFHKDGRPMKGFGKEDPVFAKHGFERAPLELRSLTGNFDPADPACLLLRLRGFFGISSRAEICLYLITHAEGEGENPTRMAKETGYSQKVIQDALVGMGKSGLVLRRESERDTRYHLVPRMRDAMINDLKAPPVWFNHADIFAFLEAVWLMMDSAGFDALDPAVQSIELRGIVDEHQNRLLRSGLPELFDGADRLHGTAYVQWTTECVSRILHYL